MKEKNLFAIVFVGIILLVVFLFYFRSAPANENTLKIAYDTSSIVDGPLIIATDVNIFQKHNLLVELIPLQSGKEVQQAISAGTIDIGSSGVTNFFIPISKGAPVKIIAASTVSPSLIFVNPQSNIKTLSDLVNKNIASRTGSVSNFALGYALLKENISLNSITLVDISSSTRPIALMEKNIVDAAVAGVDDNKTYYDFGAVILEEWVTKGYVNKTFPRSDIAVNSDFMDKNREIVNRFIDAFIESQKFIKDNPDEAARIIAKRIKEGTDGAADFSVEDIKEAWKTTKYVLWYDPNQLVEISGIEKEMGDISSALTLEQIYDLTFAEKLKNAQNEIYPTN